MPVPRTHFHEVGDHLLDCLKTRWAGVALKVWKRGSMRQFPAPQVLGNYLPMLLVEIQPPQQIGPGPEITNGQTAQLSYEYDVIFMARRADGDESNAIVEAAMASIADALMAENWLHGNVPGATSCVITKATLREIDPNNPAGLDNENYRIVSLTARVVVEAVEYPA